MTEQREPAIDEKRKREALRAKRGRLFDQFSKKPSDIKLAIQIKEIDDQVAASVAHTARTGTPDQERKTFPSVKRNNSL